MQLTRARRITATITALLAVVMLAACSSPAPKERTITLTFIRHGESQGNADGVADTAVPGPSLTPAGEHLAVLRRRGWKGLGDTLARCRAQLAAIQAGGAA